MFAQFLNERYRDLKKENSSITNFSDSTLFVKYTLVNRFTEDTSVFLNTFLFYKKKNTNFEYFQNINSPYTYYFKNNVFYSIKGNGDSTAYSQKPFSFDKSHSSSLYFVLGRIPTRKKGDFSIFRYSKPKVVVESNDTMVISQIDRKYGGTRYLCFSKKDYRIYRLEKKNNDTDRPDSYFNFEIAYFQKDRLDSLNREYKLGQYYESKIKAEEKELEVVKSTVFDSICLLGNPATKTYGNKFVLFDYWYLGCSPCIQMMPFMNELNNRIDTSKVTIIGVNMVNDKDDILRYKNQRGYDWVQLDKSKTKPLHDLNSHPQLILVDKNMKDVKVFKGYGKGVSDLEIKLYLKSMNLLK